MEAKWRDFYQLKPDSVSPHPFQWESGNTPTHCREPTNNCHLRHYDDWRLHQESPATPYIDNVQNHNTTHTASRTCLRSSTECGDIRCLNGLRAYDARRPSLRRLAANMCLPPDILVTTYLLPNNIRSKYIFSHSLIISNIFKIVFEVLNMEERSPLIQIYST